jgi:hypothetical protein
MALETEGAPGWRESERGEPEVKGAKPESECLGQCGQEGERVR